MISKRFLLAIFLLALPLTACFAHDVRQKEAPAESLSERLQKSEYVVEKGELTRRPKSVAGTAISPNHDQEVLVMKKGLEAAKAKLTIPDGAGVIINDGKEHYEVIIGNAPQSEVLDVPYLAKVLVDKKSLDVVQTSVNDVKNMSDEANKKVAEFQRLSERLGKSEYVVEKGELTRRSDAVASASTSLSHDQEFLLLKKGFDAAKSKLAIPDGSGVIVNDVKDRYEIIIGPPPQAGVLGPDYVAKVLVDKKSGEVVQILAGG